MADEMDDVRGTLFDLMAMYGAPAVIAAFGMVAQRLGCVTGPLLQCAAQIEKTVAAMVRERLAQVSANEAELSRRAEEGRQP